jgi:hypothetical protein
MHLVRRNFSKGPELFDERLCEIGIAGFSREAECGRAQTTRIVNHDTDAGSAAGMKTSMAVLEVGIRS